MFEIVLTSKAKRGLKNLSKQHKEVVGLIFEDLKEDPAIGKSLTRELTGKFSLRVGVLRIIYKINRKDNIIHIITVGHRSIIYN
ncbi:hypothetical protein A3D00_05410 [Candidatus Woesebacteria bacterium RIFCSPHIGHO2_02_FULL_38_9]|uniref:Addiction module toxin RelE n=1 Tax=Candidatus Woesebacteria bacterium RIFCSPHIGHO2_01_FULL_39_28 TaxID=1802496 RepID=A0A1F7YJV0_9BACT|nr:MAG: hypothetical protein A2627_05730 [Candidatus Woesebacteria bacterium RIFCSPHIGHO2_01_FULL_39_28]OGM33308.1 MAG: hypothetical protein A3D00_05410 [Candidatus Woesebacteria bacterium RIFCSPHIGHO2_02_FULL_38_9]OGM56671.1 MAG: hypothetical protein A3A50_04925 [Candidatus Woesebacteria bacterium RIFCSPLOWO2_01_FULL_38_20]